MPKNFLEFIKPENTSAHEGTKVVKDPNFVMSDAVAENISKESAS
jgi:hypothetical protein